MPFQKISAADADITITLGGVDKKTGKKNPTEIEGFYLGPKVVPSKFSASGEALLHVFLTPEGNKGVWGKTNLDKSMKKVIPGTLTRVVFVGMTDIKGRQPMYTYEVSVNLDQIIDVETVSAEESSDVSSVELDQEDAKQDAQLEQLTAAASRKAKVEALLKSKKN